MELADYPRTLMGVPGGASGTRATLRLMRDLVRHYKASAMIRDKAIYLTSILPQQAFSAEARALYEYVRDSIRYVMDINGLETLQDPEYTMQCGAGDCDDKSTLLASMLESIGHPTQLVAVGFQQPGQYEHVFVRTMIGSDWISLDPCVPDKPMGWQPPGIVASMIQRV